VAGDAVRVSGLGTFNVAARPPRQGRNPQTGEAIQIAASKAVRFHAGKAVKDALNPPEPSDQGPPAAAGRGGKGHIRNRSAGRKGHGGRLHSRDADRAPPRPANGGVSPNYDVLLTPALATLPPKLGWIDMMMDDVHEYWRRVFHFSPF